MIEPRIVWDEQARARVLARRKADVPAAPALDRDKLWPAVVRRIQATSVEAGLHETDAALRPAVQKALAELRRSTPPRVTHSPAWAVVLRLAARGSIFHGSTDFLLASTSLRKTIAIWIDAMNLDARSASAGGLAVCAAKQLALVHASPNLRYALLKASPSTRAWAREQLAPTFKRANLRTRAEIISVLPNEVDWVNRVVRDLVKTQQNDWKIIDHLFGAVSDPKSIVAVLQCTAPGLWSYECLLDAAGLDIVPTLLAFARNRQFREFTLERLVTALSIVCHEDVARFMMSLPRSKAIRPCVQAYRQRVPELEHVFAPAKPKPGRATPTRARARARG